MDIELMVEGQMGALQTVGVQRVILQWLELDDSVGLEALDKTVLLVFG